MDFSINGHGSKAPEWLHLYYYTGIDRENNDFMTRIAAKPLAYSSNLSRRRRHHLDHPFVLQIVKGVRKGSTQEQDVDRWLTLQSIPYQ